MVLRSTISTQFQHLRSSAGAVRVGHPYGTSGGDSSCTTTESGGDGGESGEDGGDDKYL